MAVGYCEKGNHQRFWLGKSGRLDYFLPMFDILMHHFQLSLLQNHKIYYVYERAFPRQLRYAPKPVQSIRRLNIVAIFSTAEVKSKAVIRRDTIYGISHTFFSIWTSFKHATGCDIHIFSLYGVVPYFAVNVRQFPDS